MPRTTVLVPIRFPLHARCVQTLSHAATLANGFDDAHLVVLHVNVLHRGGNVTSSDLRRAVEDELGPLANASYHVSDAYLLERAILDEVSHHDADYIVIGESMRGRWRRRLAERLDVGVDLEAFLDCRLPAELVVTRRPDRATSMLTAIRGRFDHDRDR